MGQMAPVKYITGIITNNETIRDHVVHNLTDFFGKADYIGPWHKFENTNYYASEMGEDLRRCFVSFEKLMVPELVYKAKIYAVKVEDLFRENGRRKVNLDPGYIDYYKIILASGKYGGHKIAVTKGCWADFIMMYSKGKWNPLPWCFPDFSSGIYDEDLKEIRRLFKAQRQSMGS